MGFGNTIQLENQEIPTESGVEYTLKVVSIGPWDMNSVKTKSIAHGLSATEWKTAFLVSIMVKNDLDNKRYPIDNVLGTTPNGYFQDTFYIAYCDAGGTFASPNFSSTAMSRGELLIAYIKD